MTLRNILATTLVLGVSALATGAASAATVSPSNVAVFYDYEGNNFDTFIDNIPPTGTYTSANRLTGWFELDAPLGSNLSLTDISLSVLSFSFTDGLNTRTPADTGWSIFVSTDAGGDITGWNIFLLKALASSGLLEGIASDVTGDLGFVVPFDPANPPPCTDFLSCAIVLAPFADGGAVTDNPGTWTVKPIPLPAALPLFLTALVGLGFIARRRKQGA